MSEEKLQKKAREVFGTICRMLDEKDWRYQKDEDALKISCGVQGDDLPMPIRIELDAERQLVVLLSEIPFAVPEDRRSAIAVAVSVANYGMVYGNFDFDYLNGNILFRATAIYAQSLIGQEMFAFMVACSCHTIDRYNDKFLVVTQNDMTEDEVADYID